MAEPGEGERRQEEGQFLTVTGLVVGNRVCGVCPPQLCRDADNGRHRVPPSSRAGPGKKEREEIKKERKKGPEKGVP